MGPKVSVIVPIYSVEAYLPQCVESLLNQTLTDIEIILVNDGSPDKCGEIAQQYAQKDSRVKVIHQQNSGLGPARNSGMEIATGEYIGFVDSDDWVKIEMYERLYSKAQHSGADIVVGGHCKVAKGRVVSSQRHPLADIILRTKAEIAEIRKNLYGHDIDDKQIDAFPMSVCFAIYRRSIIKDLRFMEIQSEDIIFNLSAYQKAGIMAFTANVDYCYRKDGQASITQSFSVKKANRLLDFLRELSRLASMEADVNCVTRMHRTSIDYCRAFAGIVDASNLKHSQKVLYLKQLVQNDFMRYCWSEYPKSALPFQQRIFHIAVERGYYSCALFLSHLRNLLQQAERMIYQMTHKH